MLEALLRSASRADTPEWPTLASHITGSFAGCSPNDVLHPLLQDENPCHWQASCCRRLESELLKSVTEDRSLFHTQDSGKDQPHARIHVRLCNMAGARERSFKKSTKHLRKSAGEPISMVPFSFAKRRKVPLPRNTPTKTQHCCRSVIYKARQR